MRRTCGSPLTTDGVSKEFPPFPEPRLTFLLLFVAAAVAGALNSVAGGGSFISFPALLFSGVTPVIANATNSVALWPAGVASAIAYRKDLDIPRLTLLV